MPGLRAQLRSGECGVTWVPPESTEVVEEDDNHLLLRDPAAQLVWQVSASPFPFALDAAHDEVLRADLELSAREAFDKAWKPPVEGKFPARRRTEDPTWSPVIEQRRLDLPGGSALRLLRRTAYQPGREIVCGHVIVPTAMGHINFWAIARAETTGLRETLVTATMRQGPESGPDAAEPDAEMLAAQGDAEKVIAMPFIPQATFDDSGLDAQFPEHPLTLVRQAIGKLCDSVAITRAATSVPEIIHLEEPRCAFVAPPRYVPVPGEVTRSMGMRPTLRVLMRWGVESWHRDIEVWRLEGKRFRRRDPRDELCALARDLIAGWTREGATGIKANVKAVNDFEGRPQVQQWVRMQAEGIPTQSLFRWWLEPDGVVFRIGSSGPPSVPDIDHAALLDGVQATWRRLDAVKLPHRPWWRIW
jgi:hypothetical protein